MTGEFKDPTLGTRIAIWRWGVAIKRYPHGSPFPVNFHFEKPERYEENDE